MREQVPYALAFGAGLLATVNPCGFALLPSFVSYYLGVRKPGAESGGAVGDALAAGLVLTAGFLTVFGSVGLAFALGARAVVEIVPWAAIGIGIVLVAIGVWLLAGRHIPIRLPMVSPSHGGGQRSVFAFGVAYGVGSLSCTLPVFLVVVSSAISTGSALDTLGVVAAYALGMSTILMLICLGTAGFREVLVRVIRPVMPHVTRISGALLLLGGGYVVYYWTSLLSGSGESRPVRLVQDLQSGAQDLVLKPGQRFWLAAGVALLAGAAFSLLLRSRRTRAPDPAVESASRPAPVERPREEEARAWVARKG